MKVDIVEHNSQDTKVYKSHLCYVTYSYVNPGWILNKWCPVCVCSAKKWVDLCKILLHLLCFS